MEGDTTVNTLQVQSSCIIRTGTHICSIRNDALHITLYILYAQRTKLCIRHLSIILQPVHYAHALCTQCHAFYLYCASSYYCTMCVQYSYVVDFGTCSDTHTTHTTTIGSGWFRVQTLSARYHRQQHLDQVVIIVIEIVHLSSRQNIDSEVHSKTFTSIV